MQVCLEHLLPWGGIIARLHSTVHLDNAACAKVRDITTRPEWWDAYSLTIPVLTVAREDSGEEVALVCSSQIYTA